MGVWDKFRQGLKKTTQLLNTDIRDLFKGQGRLVDDAFLGELQADLVKTDMGVEPAKVIVAEVGHQFRARVVEMGALRSLVRLQIKALLAQAGDGKRTT